MDDTKTPSPEHTVPESNDHAPPRTPMSIELKIKEEMIEVKSEPIDDCMVESAAKELFGNDLLFNQDDLQTEEFWNELIETSENTTSLTSSLNENKLLSDDLVELNSSIKIESTSPTSNFFSSALHPPTLAGFWLGLKHMSGEIE